MYFTVYYIFFLQDTRRDYGRELEKKKKTVERSRGRKKPKIEGSNVMLLAVLFSRRKNTDTERRLTSREESASMTQ
jgi:hypothetical protein